MTDPVDALARVLAEHQPLHLTRTTACLGCEWRGETAEDAHRHVAEAVLASGVVVAADKVRALADELEATTQEAQGMVREHWRGPDFVDGQDFATEKAVEGLRSLLSEPATDAAPTGEAQRASWGVTGHRADQVATPTGEAQYADAAGVTLAEVAENWRRNTASLREHIERTDAIAREVSLPEGEQR